MNNQAATHMDSQPRTLSSSQTSIMKFLFPIIWIGGFAGGTAWLFLSPDSLQTGQDGPPDPSMKWLFLVATIVGTIFIWWGCVRLKRVRMDDKALYISNYSREAIVPFANVAGVTENRWINIHPVTIQFHADTDFGSQVTFMPKTRWFAFWSSHPVVEEIRLAVSRATGRDRA
jgi:hypothetical protein